MKNYVTKAAARCGQYMKTGRKAGLAAVAMLAAAPSFATFTPPDTASITDTISGYAALGVTLTLAMILAGWALHSLKFLRARG
jgi:hypothetical protein